MRSRFNRPEEANADGYAAKRGITVSIGGLSASVRSPAPQQSDPA
jgi:hypothetical protein